MTKEKIKLLEDLLAQGHRVAVEDKDGNWEVFMYQRPDGKFQGTLYVDSIEKALEEGMSGICWSKEELEEHFTDNYKVVTPAPKIPKKGDIVEILEIARECSDYKDWDEEEKEMVGQKGFEVRYGNNLSVSVYAKDKSDWFTFPAWAVAFSEEGPDDKMEEAEELIKKAEDVRREIINHLYENRSKFIFKYVDTHYVVYTYNDYQIKVWTINGVDHARFYESFGGVKLDHDDSYTDEMRSELWNMAQESILQNGQNINQN